MPLIPHRFLFRLALPCRHVADIPHEGEDLFDLPEECRLDNFADMDDRKNFADVRLAWNERGLALQVDVRGKDQPVTGDVARPRQSDGVSLWVDTRDARTSHRASRHCHLFHFLPTGGGEDRDQPAFAQTKINRAAQDAPEAPASAVPFHFHLPASGYRLTAFLTAAALPGFDPDQQPHQGIFYARHHAELGER